MTQSEISKTKEKYPAGTRIRLLQMCDSVAPVEPLMLGTVSHVDDAGQIHMRWDNGRILAIVPEVDEFEVIAEAGRTEEKSAKEQS